MESAARRVAGIIRRHAGAGRLTVVIQLGIARGLARGRALWLRLVHGLRTLLVRRLLFTALISDDALVGMGHDSSRLFAVSKRLRAGASKVPTREIRLLSAPGSMHFRDAPAALSSRWRTRPTRQRRG